MSDLAASISAIKFTSIASTGKQFRHLNLATDQVGPAVSLTLQRSATSGLRLARCVLTSVTDPEQGWAEAQTLIQWAAGASSPERQLVAQAVRLSSDNLLLVHHLTTMPRQTARPFMADYFAAGVT